MARSAVMALSFAVLLAVLDLGACLKCYQCNSQNDKSCMDPFKGSTNMVECPSKASEDYNRAYLSNILTPNLIPQINTQGASKYCHKLITVSNTVIRACLDSNPLQINQTCALLDGRGIANFDLAPVKLLHCSACNKDNCNGVGAISASLPLAALTVLVSYLIFKQ